ncbi:MAG TPA: thiol peroxidase [Acidimicrobiia bacterium]|jgi:thiol peroxidase
MTERTGVATFQGNPLTLIGDEVQVGQTSPDFTVLTTGLEPYSLADGKGKVRILNVVLSLDTGICNTQGRRFAQEAAGLPGVDILTISADLPFAQARWANEAGVGDTQQLLSDHRDLSFGQAYGLVVKELRLIARSLFVLDADDTIVYAQYMNELAAEPDYAPALAAAKEAAGIS